MLIKGLIGGNPVFVVGDTGSTCTFISEDLIPLLLPQEPHHELPFPITMSAGTGTTNVARRYVNLSSFQLGEEIFSYPFIIAPGYKNVIILGMDFLQENQWEKARGQNKLILNNHQEVPFEVFAKPFPVSPTQLPLSTRKVTISHQRNIPPKSSVTCYGVVKDFQDHPETRSSTRCLMQPNPSIHDFKNVQCALDRWTRL